MIDPDSDRAAVKSLMVVAVAVAVVALLCWLAVAAGPTEPRTLAPSPFPPRPAPRKGPLVNRQHPAVQRGQAVATIARGEPGAWVQLAAGLTAAQADMKMTTVRRQPSVAFQPRGSFDAQKQRCVDGTYLVQVRYVGQTAAEGGEPRV